MPTIAAGNSAEIFVPLTSSITITPGSGGVVEFACAVRSGTDPVAPRIIRSTESIDVPSGSTVFALARGASATYTDPAFTAAEVRSVQALVSGARNTGGMSPYLARRRQSLLECWAGKVKSLANAADHTTRVFRTLECHADRIRVGIINCVAADLVNVRVSVGTSDTMPADLASLHGSTTTAGAILSNGSLSTSVAFTVAAGTSVTRPKITWSPWMDVLTVDRADGGTLPAVRVSIEIPATGNANRPAYDPASTRAGWESQGDATTAPYGRPYKARNGTGLGVTTPSAGSSTTYSDDTVPFVLEYIPRDGVMPLSLAIYGDSISEGSGGTPFGHGWAHEARALLSTPAQPIGICNMAMASATHAEYADRVEAVAADLACEAAILSMFTPNGITAPTFSASSSAPAQRRANQRARAELALQNALVIGFSGIPMEPAFKDLNAAGAQTLNAYMEAVRQGSLPMIDAWGAMLGQADAEGQFACLPDTLADGVHPNANGYRNRIAPEVVRVLRSLLLAPAA